ncbi:ATP-binding cassette domain-containing protein [Trebonia kvetii]|uniref:ATP-binding cassette domain-containing protein n=1 Tax=Trebonia kvetii TaxID=2480626 RepID=A0A6P2BTT8_9ACTN|nr:branched-chain amino acid ABC transporter permease/ATP-binding protein [Trebonia kvetii]TVZ02400.1 ATP-binding cassette domain-containing protein [Trebonia kvetii]
MSTTVLFLILGLGSGAVYASLALGLVVTYRSSGVVNLASGAVALYIAYTYAYLRMGQLVDPIPGLSPTADLGTGPLGFWPALLISLAVGAVLGGLLYVLIFRPLRAAPAAAKAVASVGVMIVLQALLATRLGSAAVTVAPIFPAHVYQILGSRVPGDRLWSAAIIVAVSVALGLWFRLTRFGLATRAAAESEKGAFVTGLSPQRIALVNWALSTAIVGIGGVLISPIVPLTPASYSLFIVPALAAALVGNFSKIGVTVAAALAIGMLESEATYLQTKSWLTSAGLPDLVPLLVILVFLVLRGRELPARGAIIAKTLGQAPRPRGYLVPGVVIVVLGLVSLTATHGADRAAVITTLVMAVIALSQVVVTGFTGQISFAQLTLAGVGAFSLTRIQHQLHVPFPFAPLLAAVIAMIIGVVVGLPALRIRGLPVAVTTLALAVALQDLWFNNPDLNGGYAGAPVADARIFGLDLGVGAGRGYPQLSFGILCLIVLLLAAGGVAVVRRSRLGAEMLAVRANERSAAAAGVAVSQVKLIAFAIGGFLAGLGGAMLAYQQTSADYSSYTAMGSVTFFATVYIAGITCVSGGINAGIIAAGGIIYTLINKGVPLWIYVLLVGLLLVGIVQLVRPKAARAALAVVGLVAIAAAFHHGPVQLGVYYAAINGVLLILTIILNPEGIVGPVHAQLAALRARLQARRSPARALQPVAAAVPAQADKADEAAPAARGRQPHDPARPLLTVSGVSVRYGAVVANEDVSFEVFPGEIVGLIGPNGAGKTTLIDAVSGYARATGSVALLGRKLDGRKPFQRSRDGLGRTFQGIELYDDLSVRENVEVGTTAARSAGVDRARADREQPSLGIDAYFEILGLQAVADDPVRELSVGQRQLVSVARALAGRPTVVLLDEPAAGLDAAESRWLGERLRAIRDAGTTIVMVDHDMGLVLDVCDRIVVLDLGRVVAVGTPADIVGNDEVKRAYLGTTHAGVESAS